MFVGRSPQASTAEHFFFGLGPTQLTGPNRPAKVFFTEKKYSAKDWVENSKKF